MSFVTFSKKLLAAARLAIGQQIEYRFNFFVDAALQPMITACVEILLWTALFRGMETSQIGGFARESYLLYALWAAFFARVATTWMYESRMISEIESGTANAILVRPFSFYSFYLGQFMGYKIFVTVFSFLFPLAATLILGVHVELTKVLWATILCLYNLFFVHTLSFALATLAFRFTKVHSFSMAKNLFVFLLTGELFPLDLLPTWIRDFMVQLPFSSGVYLPVAYISERIGDEVFFRGFASVTIGWAVMGIVAWAMWRSGSRVYSGTGA